MAEDANYRWTDEMIEGLAEEAPKHITAEELLTWFRCTARDVIVDLFGTSEMNVILSTYSSSAIIRKIEELEAKSKIPTIVSITQEFAVTYDGERPIGVIWHPRTPPEIWCRQCIQYSDGTDAYTEPKRVPPIREEDEDE